MSSWGLISPPPKPEVLATVFSLPSIQTNDVVQTIMIYVISNFKYYTAFTSLPLTSLTSPTIYDSCPQTSAFNYGSASFLPPPPEFHWR